MQNFIFSLLFCTLYLANSSWAVSVKETDEYKKYCSKINDQTTELVCAVSNQLNINPIKISLAMVLASVEMTGTYCNFNFSRKFLDLRIKIETDLEISKAIIFLISTYRGKPPPGFKGDRKVFCNLQWQTFGPRSKENFYESN